MYSKNLEIVRRIQEDMPFVALGGSLGLLLHGCDLGREWSNSDIDLIAQNGKLKQVQAHFKDLEPCEKENVDYGNDFDFNTTIDGVKVELSVQPRLDFKSVFFEGHSYLVQTARQIIRVKQSYAAKGMPSSQKHIDDFDIINKWAEINNLNTYDYTPKNQGTEDDLPF